MMEYYEPPVKPEGFKRLIFVSDIHLQHRNTPTWLIIENLKYYILNAVMLNTVDAIIIPGDLHDKISTLSSSGVNKLTRFYNDLLYLAKYNNVAIRILEGTPLHDRKQSARIIDLNEKVGADCRYYDEMSIVTDEVLGLTIGYVPDECRETYAQTEIEMEEMLKTRGISKIDLFVMHGIFEFQLPIPHDSYNSNKWQKWTNYKIVIGHDHNPKSKGKIIVPGPFDGLKHGEGAKGFVIIDFKGDDWRVQRVVNKRAMKYTTLDLHKLDDYEAIARIEEELNTFDQIAQLKLKLNSEHMLAEHISEWRTKYYSVTITVEKIDLTEKSLDSVSDAEFKLTMDVINVTEDNIEGMILREIDAKDAEHDISAVTEEIRFIKSMVVFK